MLATRQLFTDARHKADYHTEYEPESPQTAYLVIRRGCSQQLIEEVGCPSRPPHPPLSFPGHARAGWVCHKFLM
jgi:hypothetical protein